MTAFYISRERNIKNFLLGRNIILVLTFWGHNQFGALHFGANQFDHYYFQLTLNLVFTVNLLTENAYMANNVHY